MAGSVEIKTFKKNQTIDDFTKEGWTYDDVWTSPESLWNHTKYLMIKHNHVLVVEDKEHKTYHTFYS